TRWSEPRPALRRTTPKPEEKDMTSRRLPSLALALVGDASLGIGVARAQNQNQSLVLDLPLASQRAAAEQRLGVTDIRIDYHRPEIRGRTTSGDLLPHAQ